MEVRPVSVDEWEAVRDTRLAALADAPWAFGSTYRREVAFEGNDWRRLIESGSWFLARVGGQPVGIVAGVCEDDLPSERHLVAMWVAPEHRGTLVADQLVDAVCVWAQRQGASSVTLWVADGNSRARRFYERLGFHSTGRRQPLPSAPEVGEERMQRKLGPSAGS